MAEPLLGEREGAWPGQAVASMGAQLPVADRKIELRDIPAPPAPAAGEVQIRIKAIGLNHIDVWGWPGMAFPKRPLPLIVGGEPAGEIATVGAGVTPYQAGEPALASRRP